MRNIDMPEMTEAELVGAIEFQAQDYIPIPVEDAVLDFQILGRRTDAEGQPRQEVLLVAAQRAMIDTLLGSLKQAGLKVSGVDVSSLALVRALVPGASFLADPAQAGVCRGLVDISSSVSTLVVAVDDALKFTRVINFSSDRFARVISRAAGHTVRGRLGSGADRRAAGPARSRRRRVLARGGSRDPAPGGQGRGRVGRRDPAFLRLLPGPGGRRPRSRSSCSAAGARWSAISTLTWPRRSDSPSSSGTRCSRVSDNSSSLSDDTLALIGPSLAVAIGLALPEED